MSSITYEYRWTHPTTADVMGKLDVSHCNFCRHMGVGEGNAWEVSPNSNAGRRQLGDIGIHVLAQYPRGNV